MVVRTVCEVIEVVSLLAGLWGGTSGHSNGLSSKGDDNIVIPS